MYACKEYIATQILFYETKDISHSAFIKILTDHRGCGESVIMIGFYQASCEIIYVSIIRILASSVGVLFKITL